MIFMFVFLGILGENQYMVFIEGKNTNTPGVGGGSVSVPSLHVGFY